jgi:hypothetical protein
MMKQLSTWFLTADDGTIENCGPIKRKLQKPHFCLPSLREKMSWEAQYTTTYLIRKTDQILNLGTS